MSLKYVLLLAWLVLSGSCKLRAPAVPLVVTDPYTSIWSMSDRLTDDYTRHWAGGVSPMTGMLMVDDSCYRFLGPRDLSNLECAGVME